MESQSPLSQPGERLPKHQILCRSLTFLELFLPEGLHNDLAKLWRFLRHPYVNSPLYPYMETAGLSDWNSSLKAKQSMVLEFVPGSWVERRLSNDSFTAQGDVT